MSSSSSPTFKIHTEDELKGKVKEISNCPGSGTGPACNNSFGVFTWRHLCRVCVGTFCDSCCPERDKLVRICHGCLPKYLQMEVNQKRNFLSLFAKCKLPDRLHWKMETLLEKWQGIMFDDSGALTVADSIWYGYILESDLIVGPLSAAVWRQLGALFPKLRRLVLHNNKLSMEGGVLELGSNLPPGLMQLVLSSNQFSGSVDLTKLPEGLTRLSLADNQFSGSVDLTQLPGELRELWLNKNQFSGSVYLTKLPEGLEKLLLENNQFSGSVDLTKLPEGLTRLSLADNQFSGSVDLTQLPERLETLFLHRNQFDTIIEPASGMPRYFQFDKKVKRITASSETQQQPAAAATATAKPKQEEGEAAAAAAAAAAKLKEGEEVAEGGE